MDLTVMNERELAAMRAEEGSRIAEVNGRFWYAMFPGFYQPVHLLAQFRASEIRRPTALCWGYRAALVDEDAGLANGSIPVHLLTDITGFSERTIDESRRRDLRRSRREVEVRRTNDPSIIVEHGYDVFMSAQRRVPYFPHITEDVYRARMRLRTKDDRRLFVIGLVDGKLAGYLESYAVDGILYANEIFVATEAMRSGLGTGLYVETILTGQRAGTVSSVCLGLETPERHSLDWFKDGLGMPVIQIPARWAIPGLLSRYVRARRPYVHYRLTGIPLTSIPPAQT